VALPRVNGIVNGFGFTSAVAVATLGSINTSDVATTAIRSGQMERSFAFMGRTNN
jgi:hypothetical protein